MANHSQPTDKERGLADRRVGDRGTSEAATTAPVPARGPRSIEAPQEAPRKKGKPTKKETNFLGCVTPEAYGDFKEYAKFAWKAKKEDLKSVNSWEQLKGLLQQYRRIEKLVLDTHGGPGELIIGKVRPLDHPEIIKLFSTNMPDISEIHFEGCNVGRNPVPLVKFGNLFGVKTISAWSLFHTVEVVFVEIERRLADEAQCIEIQDMYRGYWIGGEPDIEELKKLGPGRHRFFVEWFSQIAPRKDDRLPPLMHPAQLREKYRYISPRGHEVWRFKSEEAQKIANKLGPTEQWGNLIKIIIQF